MVNASASSLTGTKRQGGRGSMFGGRPWRIYLPLVPYPNHDTP